MAGEKTAWDLSGRGEDCVTLHSSLPPRPHKSAAILQLADPLRLATSLLSPRPGPRCHVRGPRTSGGGVGGGGGGEEEWGVKKVEWGGEGNDEQKTNLKWMANQTEEGQAQRNMLPSRQ